MANEPVTELERVRQRIFNKKRISSDSGVSVSLSVASRNSYMSSTDEATLIEEDESTPVDFKQTKKFFENLDGNRNNGKNHFYSAYEIDNTVARRRRRTEIIFRVNSQDRDDGVDLARNRLSNLSTGSSVLQSSSTTDDADDDKSDSYKSEDDSGTTDEVTINSVEEISNVQSSEPSNEISKKDYGFYSTFPGIYAVDENDNDNTDNDSSDSEFLDEEESAIDELTLLLNKKRTKKGSSQKQNEVNLGKQKEESLDPIVAKQKAIEREIWHAMTELIVTERNYVKQLQYVCENYKPEMDRDDIPTELKGRAYYLFGNIEKIYEFHRDTFCPALEECNMDCQEIAATFTKYKTELYIYTLYAMNKPRSAKLMLHHGDFFKEKQSEIGDRMGIASYLLCPIQRMIKYGQLIERLTKNLKKLKEQGHESLDISELCGVEVEQQRIASALEIIEGAGNTLLELQKQADDVQLITYVYNSPINLEIPHLLMTGKLIVNRKSVKYQVFLFDNMLLYAEPMQQESNEIFYYKRHLMLDEMDPPLKLQNSNTQFSITTGSKSTCCKTTYFKAANKEERDKWYTKIFELLFQQLHDMKRAFMEQVSYTVPRTKKKSIDATKFVEKPSIYGYSLPNIIDCEISLNTQGRVMKCGDVTLTNEKNTYRGHMLLFEKIVILTKFQNSVFTKALVFQDSIDTKNLGMSPLVSNSPTQFNLWCIKSNNSYTVQTRSVEEKSAWTRRITDTLNSIEPLLSNQRNQEEFEVRQTPLAKSLRGVPGERKSKRNSLRQISQWYCD